MRILNQITTLKRFIGILSLYSVVLLGICLPIHGYAVPKPGEAPSGNGCAVKLEGQSALAATQAKPKISREKEAVLESRFNEKAKKYISIIWSRQEFYSEEFVTTVHRTRESVTRYAQQVEPSASDQYLKEVSPLIDLANKYFESRRGWGTHGTDPQSENPFSKKNLKVAKDYLLQSSYVLVHDHSGKLLGGMRNIQLRDQDSLELPEEKFLHIKVPQMGLAKTNPGATSWKNEAGAFVIEEGYSPEMHQKVRLEIWTNLYRFIFSKSSVRENYYDQAVHTYGDRKSVIMYKASGFQKLRIYSHNGKWIDYTQLAEKDIPPIDAHKNNTTNWKNRPDENF